MPSTGPYSAQIQRYGFSLTHGLIPVSNFYIPGATPTSTVGMLYSPDGSTLYFNGGAVGGGTGTVTSVSVTTANGVSGSVATPTTTPAITLTLGAIVPTSVKINNTAPTFVTVSGATDIVGIRSANTFSGIQIQNSNTGSSSSDGLQLSSNASGIGFLYNYENAAITFGTNNSSRWSIDASGNFITVADNTYDIGASGATRPRTGYFGTSAVAPKFNATTNFQANGTDGVTAGPFTVITSITVKGGIITALTGS